MSLPGGCAIGARPIDLHIKGLERLGAKITQEHGYIEARAERLKGARIVFEKITVTGTEDLLMAATLAEGETVLQNCAREPEVVDLAALLNKMGAQHRRRGHAHDSRAGCREAAWRATSHHPRPHRGGNVHHRRCADWRRLHGCQMRAGSPGRAAAKARRVRRETQRQRRFGARHAATGRCKAADMVTEEYPGFPTDMQAQYMALATQAEGTSLVTENIFENRFMHAQELVRMGANIKIEGTPRRGSRQDAAQRRRGVGQRPARLGVAGAGGAGRRWRNHHRPRLSHRPRLRTHRRKIAWRGSPDPPHRRVAAQARSDPDGIRPDIRRSRFYSYTLVTETLIPKIFLNCTSVIDSSITRQLSCLYFPIARSGERGEVMGVSAARRRSPIIPAQEASREKTFNLGSVCVLGGCRRRTSHSASYSRNRTSGGVEFVRTHAAHRQRLWRPRRPPRNLHRRDRQRHRLPRRPGGSRHPQRVLHLVRQLGHQHCQEYSDQSGATSGGSKYYNINTTYGDTTANVSNSLHYAGSTTDNYSYGKSLSDSSIKAIVQRAINNGSLPKDTNGIYFVLTTSDVNETSGFCTQYCGWHTHGSINSSDIKYAFVGDPDRCPSACEAQSKSPNNNPGADGMASVISHSTKKPTPIRDLNAWWNSQTGEENADQCAWQFGTTYTVTNGSKANMKLGSLNYLIQQNWVNRYGGYCAQSY